MRIGIVLYLGFSAVVAGVVSWMMLGKPPNMYMKAPVSDSLNTALRRRGILAQDDTAVFAFRPAADQEAALFVVAQRRVVVVEPRRLRGYPRRRDLQRRASLARRPQVRLHLASFAGAPGHRLRKPVTARVVGHCAWSRPTAAGGIPPAAAPRAPPALGFPRPGDDSIEVSRVHAAGTRGDARRGPKELTTTDRDSEDERRPAECVVRIEPHQQSQRHAASRPDARRLRSRAPNPW